MLRARIHAQKMRLLASLGRITDLAFPRTCIGCGTSGRAVCDSCKARAREPIANLPPWIHALYSYKSPIIKKSIWELKYRRTYDVARIYGKELHERIVGDLGERLLPGHQRYYLVPIPLSSARLRERGYNQSALIVKAIRSWDMDGSFRDGSAFLKRKDSPVRQSHTKGKSERLKNIVHSFYTDKTIPPDIHIVIIDDVVTTGATLEEARKVLLRAGGRTIHAYTIAH